MSDFSRREILGVGAVLSAGSLFGTDSAFSRPAHEAQAEATSRAGVVADTVVLNANVYTVDPLRPRAEALAVAAGRFIAAGTTVEIRSLAGSGTRVMDARGMTVVPGFIDAHSHPAGAGLSHLLHVDTNRGSIAAIQAALRERAAATPPGGWIIGFLYDDTKLSEERPLTRQDLDAAVPDHPVVVRHRGGHTAVYNSRAFTTAAITDAVRDPPGGHFYKDTGGRLTGKVAERANDLIDRHIPSRATREQRQAGIARISEMMTAAGVTSVHQTHGGVPDMVAFQDARRAEGLKFRCALCPSYGGSLYKNLSAAGVRSGFGDDRLRIGMVKLVADGSASERTMRMSTPYIGRPDDYGILTMTREELEAAVEEAHCAGWQIGVHANGDVAIDMVLTAYARAQEKCPRPDARHRIEHATLVNPDLLRRMKAQQVVTTPFYTYVYFHGEKWQEYGEEKVRWMFPHGSYGITAAGASDYPPGPFEPLMALQSMVTRTDYRGRTWGANQRITVDQALQVCTINGAYASFEEQAKGSITRGKLADFVVLAEDPHAVDPQKIKDIRVVRTVVGGEIVHEAATADAR